MHTPTADELGLDTATARTIAAIPDVGVRRAQAAAAHADRRDQLATYRQLYAEAYGHNLDPVRLEQRDEVLAELTVLTVA